MTPATPLKNGAALRRAGQTIAGEKPGHPHLLFKGRFARFKLI
jgi:hypothetical protein